MSEWYTINNVAAIDTPALVVYPKRVQQNIAQVIKMSSNANRLRPHVKTIKSREAVQLLMKAGISKFKCATIAEAEMLGMAGATDVLLAYQPQGPKIYRLFSLQKTYTATSFACLVDNEITATNLSDTAIETNSSLSIYIDVNVGMNRSGISPNNCFDLYKYCIGLQELNTVGLHVYDGHLHQPDFDLRTRACNDAFLPVEKLLEQISESSLPIPIVVAGGSPTFPIHALRNNVECSPGTFVYWDRGYELTCAEQSFVPAALVLSRIVSIINETTICLDLGHKSIASENDLHHRVYFLNAPGLIFKSHSEEHLVVTVAEGHSFKVGDVLYGIPWHICPTVALYERALVVEEGICKEEWKTIARDRKISV